MAYFDSILTLPDYFWASEYPHQVLQKHSSHICDYSQIIFGSILCEMLATVSCRDGFQCGLLPEHQSGINSRFAERTDSKQNIKLK